MLAVVELGLLWGGLLGETAGFYLTLLLTNLSPTAFLATWVFKRQFGGSLSDANGIRPLQLPLGGKVIDVDMNLVAVLAALLTMVLIVLMYRL
jgi:hypothetical protein